MGLVAVRTADVKPNHRGLLSIPPQDTWENSSPLARPPLGHQCMGGGERTMTLYTFRVCLNSDLQAEMEKGLAGLFPRCL